MVDRDPAPGAADPIRLFLDSITRGLASSALAGDPNAIALSLWVTLHGMVTLELAGAPDRTTVDHGFDSTIQAALRGWAPKAL